MLKRILAAVSIVAIVSVGLFFILASNDDSLTKLKRENVIRVGYAIEAPYAYIDSDGMITGESPEVARVIIAALGITDIQWIQTDFNQLIPGLLEHRYDVIAAGMFITPSRAAQVRFSNPTFHVQPGLLVESSNSLLLYSYRDIAANPDMKVAVITGAVEEILLLELGVTHDQFVFVPDSRTGQIAVESGLADVLALSCVTVRWIASKSEATESVETLTAIEAESILNWGYGGFAFRLEDSQLADAWNDAMEGYIGSTEHLDLISQFGFTSEELPGTVTVETVLGR